MLVACFLLRAAKRGYQSTLWMICTQKEICMCPKMFVYTHVHAHAATTYQNWLFSHKSAARPLSPDPDHPVHPQFTLHYIVLYLIHREAHPTPNFKDFLAAR